MSTPLLDPEFAAKRYDHGTIARYKLGKCRCELCRAAVATYERERQARRRAPFELRFAAGGVKLPGGRYEIRGAHYVVRRTATGEIMYRGTDKAAAIEQRDMLNDVARPAPGDELVSARAARRRIKELQRAGVGTPTIALRSGLGRTAILHILDGTVRRCRRSTETAIAGVSATPRGSVPVDGRETWKLLDALVAIGYTRPAIAKALGAKYGNLQLRRGRVSAINAARVRRLYAHVWHKDPRLRQLVDPCGEEARTQRAALDQRWSEALRTAL